MFELYYNGKYAGTMESVVNHSMTKEELIVLELGLDSPTAESQHDIEILENLYGKADFVYLDDNCNYQIDFDGITIELV